LQGGKKETKHVTCQLANPIFQGAHTAYHPRQVLTLAP